LLPAENIIDGDLDCARTFVYDLDLNIVHTFNCVRNPEEVKIFNLIDFVDLISQLEPLKNQTLDEEQPDEIHQAFADRIWQTWYATLDLNPEGVDLSDEEIAALENYLYANELFIRCQEAAARVSPKTWEGIESRMLTVRDKN
jgi:hypothetical protein